MWRAYLLVGLGSVLGGTLRFWVSGLVAQRIGETFPWGTLIVNATGSLLIGLFAALADTERAFVSTEWRLFLTVGVCGGYTTFSSFSLQTLRLVQDGQWLQAGGNVLLSVIVCLVAVFAGYKFGQMVG